jgi:hypothetical protein
MFYVGKHFPKENPTVQLLVVFVPKKNPEVEAFCDQQKFQELDKKQNVLFFFTIDGTKYDARINDAWLWRGRLLNRSL